MTPYVRTQTAIDAGQRQLRAAGKVRNAFARGDIVSAGFSAGPRTPRSRGCVPRAAVVARVVPVPARVIEHIAMSRAETWRLSAPGNPGDASVAAHPQADASRPVGVGQVSDGAPVAARTAPHVHATAEADGSAADDMRLRHDPLPHQRHPIDGASRDGRGRGGQRAMWSRPLSSAARNNMAIASPALGRVSGLVLHVGRRADPAKPVPVSRHEPAPAGGALDGGPVSARQAPTAATRTRASGPVTRRRRICREPRVDGPHPARHQRRAAPARLAHVAKWAMSGGRASIWRRGATPTPSTGTSGIPGA